MPETQEIFSPVWWHTPVILALGRLRQEGHVVPSQPGLQSEKKEEEEWERGGEEKC